MQSACHTSILRLALTALLVLLSASDAFAARIVGVVSNRSAAETASGAHTFLDRNASHTVILRTTDQIAALTDAQIAELEEQLSLSGRFAKDGWVEQAKELAKDA